MRTFHVYILASHSRTLYVGVTNNLVRRIHQHRMGSGHAFTSRHAVTRLVYFEFTSNVSAAIAREKQLKRWPRIRKVRLIESGNAGWIDLSAQWLPLEPLSPDAPGNP